LIRALEVFKATGTSIMDFRKGKKIKRNFDWIKIGLELPKEQLHHNIEMRVNEMVRQGLIEEARTLIPYRHFNALQTVGYKELFAYFNKETDLSSAVELIKQNSRQYAKRQITWFKKDEEHKWVKPHEFKILNLKF